MIYRIKIMDKQGKFVRYATDKEKVWLKPKDDGSGVERMILLPAAGIFGGWQDVSDTHKVEWGFTWHEDKGSMKMTLLPDDTEIQKWFCARLPNLIAHIVNTFAQSIFLEIQLVNMI